MYNLVSNFYFMIIFTQFVDTPNAIDPVEPINVVALPFERRQRSRMQVNIERGPLAGIAVGIQLPRGTVLRHGQLLASTDRQWLRIDARKRL